jgi:hypothetical protein
VVAGTWQVRACLKDWCVNTPQPLPHSSHLLQCDRQAFEALTNLRRHSAAATAGRLSGWIEWLLGQDRALLPTSCGARPCPVQDKHPPYAHTHTAPAPHLLAAQAEVG